MRKDRTELIMSAIPVYPQEATAVQIARKLHIAARLVSRTITRHGDGWLICESDDKPARFSLLKEDGHVG